MHCVLFWLNLVGFLDSGRNLTFFFEKEFLVVSPPSAATPAADMLDTQSTTQLTGKTAASPDAMPPQHQPRAAAGIANLLATWREGLTLTVLTSGGG